MKKKRITRFRSIRTSIIISFALLIVFALLTFLMISLQYTRHAVLENSTEYTSQLIGQVNSDIDSYITYMENISFIVSSNSDVSNFLYTADETGTSGRVSVVLRTIAETRDDITNIGILSDNGRYVLNYNGKMNPYVDFTQLSWYQSALEAEGKAVISSSHVQNLVEGRYDWVVTLSRRITRPAGTTAAAVFFVDLNYNSINTLCENINLGSKGYVFILDQNGNLIYHPQQQLLYSGLKEERIQEVMESTDTSFVTDDQHLYTISRSEYTGWTVVGVAYVPELLEDINAARRLYLIIAVLLFAVALGLAVLLSDAITKPIKQLENSMKEVEKGNFDHAVVGITTKNEIGRLSRSFNIMTGEIQKLMEQTEQEQKAKRKNELKALQNQMTPHFLYNTLDSIIWMAEWGKNKEVVLMTSSLAKLMRQSISNDREVVSVAEEVAYTESYLTIQKLRYKDKLEYEISVDEDIQQLEIVKLILQPLVENAIYHGIKYKEGKGMLRVLGWREEECIVLQVQDNGKGMDEETLEHIFEKHVRDTKSNGVGLNNVRERIQLYYGAEYGISFQSRPDLGTTATVRIPARKEAAHAEI
jgi:two-component system sensor histidine kinase YesM